MRALRVALLVVYASYLTNVGMLLILLPWSESWVRIVLLAPPRIGAVLDLPTVRGAVSAFGVLHLLLLGAELFLTVQAPESSADRGLR